MPIAGIAAAVDASLPLAERLFAELRAKTHDGVGITRQSYGAGEQVGFDLAAAAARDLGLETKTDYAGNLYMTLAGRDREGHGVIVGSHMDSVPSAGNYDGAAGVVAGLVAVATLKQAGIQPARDISVMAIRGEEDDWFGITHIGSRAALGLLPPAELDSAKRVDTGRTLAEHMQDLGCDVAALRATKQFLDPKRIAAYFELHIEQGPVLEHDRIPVGVVTGIRGNVRSHKARCIGAYAHSGAVPRRMRHDAVLATVDYAAALESEWDRVEAAGGDLVLTFGKLFTDTSLHSLSKVPGEVSFTIDARSQDTRVLDRMEARIRSEADRIAEARGVTFALEPILRVKPAIMDADLQRRLHAGCGELGIKTMAIPSGAGHDAADFANAGVRTAMIFVRNPNGSHNPAEHMEMADFALGTRLLAWALAETA